ncbi:fimb protein [Neisseria dentiae]|uniref:fimb protein n=1 Tax=Neisseria dentiae TaxID=194197 RepID=UPI0035A144E6
MTAIVSESRWLFAAKALCVHLAICLFVVLLVSFLVFKVWYPYPYYEMVGSLKLMGLIVAVDLVCGPLLTFVVANPAKPKRELMRDFGLIGLIQLAALAYGLYALAQSRPVALAFDKDRFYAVTAVQIEPERLNKAPEAFRSLPLLGMYEVGTRKPKNEREFLEGVNLSLAGIPPAVRADWWLPRKDVEADITAARIPLKNLMDKYPERAKIIRQHFGRQNIDNIYYLPLTSEKTLDWIMVIDNNNKAIAYIPVDGFL